MRTQSEEGAVAVTTAIVLVVLILVAAFLVDLGATRADARTDQLLADAALMAGASDPGDIRSQCRTAVEYFAANVNFGTVSPSPHPCDTLPVTCDATTPSTQAGPISVGAYQIFITHPVEVGDVAMQLQGQQTSSRDGERCDRMKLTVVKTREFTLAGAGGAAGGGASAADAVARRRIEVGTKEFATLIVLDREGCSPLVVQGGSAVLVEDLSPERPGLIAVDSDGTDCNATGSSQYVILPGGSDTRICAGVTPAWVTGFFLNRVPSPPACVDPSDGEPRIFTLADDVGKAVLPQDVQAGRVRPEPDSDEPVTRLPADVEWNCLPVYATATSSAPWLPTEGLSSGCDDGTDPDIQDMATRLGFSSNTTFLTSTDNGNWSTIQSGNNCTINGTGPGQPPLAVGDGGRSLFFNCNSVVINGRVRFVPKDYVVIKGDLTLSGTLFIDPGWDNVLVLQDGKFQTSGNTGRVVLDRTGVYIHNPDHGGNGRAIDLGAGTSCIAPPGADPDVCSSFPIEWRAPEGPSDSDPETTPPTVGLCADLAGGLPTPECFEDMALWSNGDGTHRVAGLMDVRGVFFAPNAGRDNNTAFELRGGAKQPMRRAQFFTYRLDVAGGSAVLMKPDPSSILPTRELVATLIR